MNNDRWFWMKDDRGEKCYNLFLICDKSFRLYISSAAIRHLTIYNLFFVFFLSSSFFVMPFFTNSSRSHGSSDSTFRDTLGLSTKEGKLPRKSLPSSLDIVKSLCRSSGCVELEVIYHYLWDKWGLGEIAGAAESSRIIRTCHNCKAIERLWRLQVGKRWVAFVAHSSTYIAFSLNFIFS